MSGRQEWIGPFWQPAAVPAKLAAIDAANALGGAESVIDCCYAAAFLAWALLAFEALLVIAESK